MKTRHFLLGCALTAALSVSGMMKAQAEIKEGPVEYKAGDVV
jgi:hypothetical protein